MFLFYSFCYQRPFKQNKLETPHYEIQVKLKDIIKRLFKSVELCCPRKI
jgi:hypothetical protein